MGVIKSKMGTIGSKMGRNLSRKEKQNGYKKANLVKAYSLGLYPRALCPLVSTVPFVVRSKKENMPFAL